MHDVFEFSNETNPFISDFEDPAIPWVVQTLVRCSIGYANQPPFQRIIPGWHLQCMLKVNCAPQCCKGAYNVHVNMMPWNAMEAKSEMVVD